MIVTPLYSKQEVDYPLNLSWNNIITKFDICHETPFCSWTASWRVYVLRTGEFVYMPSNERNRRDIYIVSHLFRNKTLEFPQGIYKLSYDTLTRMIAQHEEDMGEELLSAVFVY